jgi:thiamine biosynthesis lipoprotein
LIVVRNNSAPHQHAGLFIFIMKYTSLFLLILGALAGCTDRSSKFREIRGYAQGTTYAIVYFDPEKRDFSPGIDSLLMEIDLSMSTYLDESLISQFNRSATGIAMDDRFKRVFSRSVEVASESGGLFDPTVENLVSAWGFGRTNPAVMNPELVQRLLAVTGIDLVEVRNDSLFKKDPMVKLTFNAIAQGYSVDEIALFLESKGVWDYLVELGGETRARGKNPQGESWRIGIEKPEASLDGRPFQAIARLDNTSLVTSGNYRKFRVDSLTGIKYSHTINPITGYPVTHSLLSATVLHPNAMDADAYATVLMVMGLEEGIRFIEQKKLDGYLIYSDSTGKMKTWVSAGFREQLITESGN